MNEVLDHLNFFEPDSYIDVLKKSEDLPKEWIQIFYIARCLFATNSSFPIKGHLAPLLEREEFFPKDSPQKNMYQSETMVKKNMAEALDIGRITSIHQISYILPREFITNQEDIFYKKLINGELCRKEFYGPEALSVSDLVYGKERELNRRQKVYILFDNSASMNGEKFNKLFAAKAMCLEYLKRVQKEEPQIYFRYFNQEMGPLFRISKPRQIKELIKYIVDLGTCECYRTKIDEAILLAAQDIRYDPEFKQAEIIMITDGLGDLPPNIKEQLGDIKFHCILISGLDIERFLELYPDKASWEKANIKVGSKEMPSFWETFLKITQVYSLQEITDIFVRIPSLYGERFRFTNSNELDLIKETRIKLAKRLEGELSNKEKYEIFQRIKFITKYLKMMLSKEPSPGLRKNINNEINSFNILIKKLIKNKWFACTLESQIKLTHKKRDELLGFVLKSSNKPKGYFHLLNFLRGLATIPSCVVNRFLLINHHMSASLSKIYRKHRLKQRFSQINSMLVRLLVR